MTIIIQDSFDDLGSGVDIGGRTPDVVDNGNTWVQFAVNQWEGDGAGRLTGVTSTSAAIDAGATDVAAQATYNPGAATDNFSLAVRSNGLAYLDASFDGYVIDQDSDLTTINIKRRLNGVTTTLQAIPQTIPLSTPITWRIEAEGTTLRAYRAGVQIGIDQEDAGIDGVTQGGGFVVLSQFGDPGSSTWDDVQIEDLAAPASGGAGALIGGGLVA